ncbi:MAG: 50S ribosomal protein L19 [Proteobacteria bacterium]|nr:50S ribosomal protein L19 [Pseudomonadota bacterium]
MNLLQQYKEKHIDALKNENHQVDFRVGDEVSVKIKISDGSNERLQEFCGLCIGRRSSGVASTFTLRKISYNEGVERKFFLYSPKIAQIKVLRKGKVRRAKLYYIRELRGKAARIKQRI